MRSRRPLLVAVAPPLLLLGLPGVAFAWALPANLRKRFTGSRAWRSFAALANVLTRPPPAAVLRGLALWIWHVFRRVPLFGGTADGA
jgi:putative membrane protein